MEANESNAVCKFLDEIVLAATGSDVLAECLIHDTLQEKIDGEKMIRVGDKTGGVPMMKADGEAHSFNVFLTVQFLAKVSPSNREQRLWARDTADRMAKAFAKEINDNRQMKGADGVSRVCGVSVEREQAGWAKPNSTLYAVHYYLLKFNDR